MQGRLRVVSGHRCQFWGMDVGSWASCLSLAAAKPGAAPLNKGFQLTAHVSGRVMNGLRFWETRLYLQFEKNLYFRDVIKGRHTPTNLSSHRHMLRRRNPQNCHLWNQRRASYYRQFYNSVGVFVCKAPNGTWFFPITILRDKWLFITIDKHKVIKLVCSQCHHGNPDL